MQGLRRVNGCGEMCRMKGVGAKCNKPGEISQGLLAWILSIPLSWMLLFSRFREGSSHMRVL